MVKAEVLDYQVSYKDNQMFLNSFSHYKIC